MFFFSPDSHVHDKSLRDKCTRSINFFLKNDPQRIYKMLNPATASSDRDFHIDVIPGIKSAQKYLHIS